MLIRYLLYFNVMHLHIFIITFETLRPSELNSINILRRVAGLTFPLSLIFSPSKGITYFKSFSLNETSCNN